MQMTNEELQSADVLIMLAIAEDIGRGDITSQTLLDKEQQARGVLVARQALTVAGVPLAERLAERYGLGFAPEVEDGATLSAGATIATLSGDARKLLTVERIMLNFIQRMSGVATLTRAYVDAVAGTNAQVLDTRKTIPAWRLLDKYAVRAGGGHNHRMGLFDAVMIKDNHIALAGGIKQAVEKVLAAKLDVPIIVECDTIAQVKEAAGLNVSRLLLDNMKPVTLKEAVALVDGRMPLEASGGVNLQTIRTIAETGVDTISVGALTHSAPAVDIALDVEIV
jgi:nicotinate-nucleotide pyrophosphorylase (carboxylating)